MKAKKVIIFGCNGMLGYTLIRYLHKQKNIEVYGTLRKEKNLNFFDEKLRKSIFTNININNPNQYEDLLYKLKPDYIINCIGIIKQKESSNKILEIIPINSLFPHQLHKIASKLSCKLIHISTDCVFRGNKGMYTEKDIPDANDLYGLSKRLGELDNDSSITLRTSIIGKEINNKKSLLEWFLNQKDQIHGYKNAIFSGLTTLELSKVIHKLIIQHSNVNGLFNVSSNPIDKYTLLKKISTKYNKNIKILLDKNYRIDRSLNGTKFQKTVGYISKDWDKMINEMYNFELDSLKSNQVL